MTKIEKFENMIIRHILPNMTIQPLKVGCQLPHWLKSSNGVNFHRCQKVNEELITGNEMLAACCQCLPWTMALW